MTWLAIIPCLVLAALPPLTAPQQEMLSASLVHTTSFDQAGLYALLTNAATWPDDPAANEPGSTSPDYPAIIANPADWQAKSCLIEGTLVSRVQLGVLSRTGYENVQSWTIRLPAASGGGGGKIVIVFLTHPPDVLWKNTIGNNTLPMKEGMKVRLVARFYTVYSTPDTKGNPLDYPLFVGKTATFPHDSPAADFSLRPLLLVTLIFVMLVAYVIVVVIRIKRSRAARIERSLASTSRRTRRKVEIRDDLPQDPAAAMDALEQEHHQDQQD